MKYRLRGALLVVAIVASGQLHAQGSQAQPSAAELQKANTLFTQSDWKGALDAYRALAASYPSHALSRFRIGVSQMELKQFPDAETNLRAGEKLGIPVPQAAIRLGQVFAVQSKADSAISELLRSAHAGMFLPIPTLEADQHFASLKSNAKWKAVVDAFDANVRPCLHDPRFREFDFWIGDWDVRPTGTPPTGPASRNTVTLNYDGCIVMEHWAGLGGGNGESYNLFDRSIGKWRQTWVDNGGGQHDYRGGIKDGNMVYMGDIPAPSGQLGRIPTRLTFFRIGKDSVRQFSETSADSGKTWTTAYDFMYVRRKQ